MYIHYICTYKYTHIYIYKEGCILLTAHQLVLLYNQNAECCYKFWNVQLLKYFSM